MPAAPARRPGRPRDEGLLARRQEEILAVAARLFAAHGYADTDVDSVADALAVGKGTVYRYFPSKQALFLAAVDRGMSRLREEVDARAAAAVDPLDRIIVAIHTFLEYFHRHPELTELFLQERAHFGGRREPAYFAHHEAHAGPWQVLWRGLVAEGRLRDLPLTPDQSVINDLLYGTILANHTTGRRVTPRKQAERIIDLIFHGVLTDAERRRQARAAGGKGKEST